MSSLIILCGICFIIILFIYNFQNDNDIIENLTNSLIIYGLSGIGILGYYLWVLYKIRKVFINDNNSTSKGDSINSDI